jgi:acylphosphatase
MAAQGDVALRVTVRGQVQGVYYRQSLVRVAAGHGVRGWVRNRPDGSVEAVLQGQPASVEMVIAWMRHGPPRAIVTGIDVESAEPDAYCNDFTVRA